MKIELTLTAESDEIYSFVQNQANDALAKSVALLFHYASAHPEVFSPLLGILSQIKVGKGEPSVSPASPDACLNCGQTDSSTPCPAPGKTPVADDWKRVVQEKNGHIFLHFAS